MFLGFFLDFFRKNEYWYNIHLAYINIINNILYFIIYQREENRFELKFLQNRCKKVTQRTETSREFEPAEFILE